MHKHNTASTEGRRNFLYKQSTPYIMILRHAVSTTHGKNIAPYTTRHKYTIRLKTACCCAAL